MHNSFVTGGPQAGIEIARSLSDISHNTYTPAPAAGGGPGAAPGELLFADSWTEPHGMETFFVDPWVHQRIPAWPYRRSLIAGGVAAAGALLAVVFLSAQPAKPNGRPGRNGRGGARGRGPG